LKKRLNKLALNQFLTHKLIRMTAKFTHIIEKIKAGIIQLNKLGNKKNGLFVNRTKRRAKLRKEQLQLLLDLLEHEDQDFNTLWNRNMDLLKGEDLIFSVSSTGSNLLNGHPSILTGKINKIGTIILKPPRHSSSFLSKNFFPKAYAGSIDANGQLSLKSVSTGINFFGSSLPKKFASYIESNGEIRIQVWKQENEFFLTGRIAKITCNPFGQDKNHRDEFLSNKDKMMRKAAQRLKAIEDELKSF